MFLFKSFGIRNLFSCLFAKMNHIALNLTHQYKYPPYSNLLEHVWFLAILKRRRRKKPEVHHRSKVPCTWLECDKSCLEMSRTSKTSLRRHTHVSLIAQWCSNTSSIIATYSFSNISKQLISRRAGFTYLRNWTLRWIATVFAARAVIVSKMQTVMRAVRTLFGWSEVNVRKTVFFFYRKEKMFGNAIAKLPHNYAVLKTLCPVAVTGQRGFRTRGKPPLVAKTLEQRLQCKLLCEVRFLVYFLKINQNCAQFLLVGDFD